MLRALLLTIVLSGAVSAQTVMKYLPVQASFPEKPKRVWMSATSEYGPMTDEKYETDKGGCHMQVRAYRLAPRPLVPVALQQASTQILNEVPGTRLQRATPFKENGLSGLDMTYALPNGLMGRARISMLGDQLVIARTTWRDEESRRLADQFLSTVENHGPVAEDEDQE